MRAVADLRIYTEEGKTFYPNGEESHNCQILDFDYDTNHTEEDVIMDYLYDNPTKTTGLNPDKIQFAHFINKEALEALRSVVSYLWEDEKRNYEEEDCPEDHIFNDIETLSYYLDKDYKELGTFDNRNNLPDIFRWD